MNKFFKILSLCFLGILISSNFTFAQNITSPTFNQYYQCPTGFVLLNYGGTTQKCVKQGSTEYQNLIKGGAKETDICSLNDFASCGFNPNCQTSGSSCIQKGTVSQESVTAPAISGGTTYTSNGDCAIVGGTPISDKNAQCNSTVMGCPSGSDCSYTVTDCPIGSGSGWKCIATPITTTLPQDTNLKAVISPYKAKVTIPCSTTAIGVSGKCPVADNPAGYIARIYQFGLMIVGFIALGAIIYGAALYTLSAGNMASKEEGKAWMLNAIYGILLLLGAYLILYTINPKLANLANPTIEPIDLDTLLPPSIYVANDCSQMKPDYSNVAQPCGVICKLDATTANGCSTNGSNNTVTQSTGGMALVGCIVSQTSGGGILDVGSIVGASINVNGQEVANTSSQTMKCTKCMDGYTLTNGVCYSNVQTAPCLAGYTGMNCADCSNGYAKLNNQCVKTTASGVCSSGLAGPNGTCIPK